MDTLFGIQVRISNSRMAVRTTRTGEGKDIPTFVGLSLDLATRF